MRKPIMLPQKGSPCYMLVEPNRGSMCYRQRPKWKIDTTYKDHARIDKEHILSYTYKALFINKNNSSLSVEFFFCDAYKDYQVSYYYNRINVITLMVDVSTFESSFFDFLVFMPVIKVGREPSIIIT